MENRAGVAPRRDDLNAERWERVKRIADDAFELPASRRRAFVARASEGDVEIEREVLRILAHDAEASRFLKPPSDAGEEPGIEMGLSVETYAGLEPGTIVANRYTIAARIGRGAYGTVYRATDVLTGATVAIKRIPGFGDEARPWLRREAATLRWLRLPGVVPLRDDGIEDGVAYVVMDYVDGAPFPGAGRGRSWSDISETVLALVETLARVHWAGVNSQSL